MIQKMEFQMECSRDVNKIHVEIVVDLKQMLDDNNLLAKTFKNGSGEIYYLRLLLNVVKGSTSYAELRRINNNDHATFRDACYALGLLDDDKEYIDAIKEANSRFDADVTELKQFSDWLLAIGDGRMGFSTDSTEKVKIPDNILIDNCDDPIS
ncbi:hypothetical protein FXO38_06608 [Capsicum annuum]|nr:hypothetical protein FXO37_14762 [Capsicum annuum]KAF3671377.1 hypothetical protein FXO38_06608 [Capsicum annuum]